MARTESDREEAKVEKSEEEWKKELSPKRYRVLREKGTEPPFTGKLLKNKENGVYECAACGNPLFSSNTKFKSETGWPSFWQPLSEESVELQEDLSGGMRRTEVICARCGSHLGHVFDDGPRRKTGKRYCINSLSLEFEQGK